MPAGGCALEPRNLRELAGFVMENVSRVFYRYLPIGGIDIDWGLYVTTAGYSIIPPRSQYPFARHPSAYHFTWDRGRVLEEYQVIYITSGSGVFESSYGSMMVSEGTVICLFPGVWHRYRPSRRTGWNEYWIGLRGDHMDRLVEKGFFSPERPVFTIGSDEALVDQYMQLVHLVETQPIGYQQVISSISMRIMATILADARGRQSGGRHTETLILRAKTALAEQVEGRVDMVRLASDLNLSYPHFRRMFKHYTNLAPHQYHLQLQINRAKELLRGTDQPIKSIASTLGYDDPYYFSKLFKKKTGKSPDRWRHGTD